MRKPRKTAFIFAAVTPGLRERVAELAAARGHTVSSLMRFLVVRELAVSERRDAEQGA